jgi:hypothetical protein
MLFGMLGWGTVVGGSGAGGATSVWKPPPQGENPVNVGGTMLGSVLRSVTPNGFVSGRDIDLSEMVQGYTKVD